MNKPVEGVKISKIEFECNHASGLLHFHVVSVNGTELEWCPECGSMRIKPHAWQHPRLIEVLPVF